VELSSTTFGCACNFSYDPIMLLTTRQAILIFPALSAFLSHAAQIPNTGFNHHDWEVVCDNTRTCRAVAYSPEDDELGATVLLTRAAGPGQRVKARLQLAYEEASKLPTILQMKIGDRALGAVRLERNSGTADLTTAQTRGLLAGVLADKDITWSGGARTWRVSTKGANAVLLKMDEFQGRIATPGALVAKGSKPEGNVLPPLPIPKVTAAKVPNSEADPHLLSAQQQGELINELRKTVSEDDCDRFADIQSGTNPLSIYRLSGDKLLVSAQCWQGVYHNGDAYWVIKDHPPFTPVLVVTAANEYGEGLIRSVQKMPGLGDC
jgi:hypothetical protein